MTGTWAADVRRLAEGILAGLPADAPALTAARREMLGEPARSPDTRCPGRRRGRPVRVDLTPWRAPSEAQWTDAELRAAWSAYSAAQRHGVLVGPPRGAAQAYRRILNRRRTVPQGVAS